LALTAPCQQTSALCIVAEPVSNRYSYGFALLLVSCPRPPCFNSGHFLHPLFHSQHSFTSAAHHHPPLESCLKSAPQGNASHGTEHHASSVLQMPSDVQRSPPPIPSKCAAALQYDHAQTISCTNKCSIPSFAEHRLHCPQSPPPNSQRCSMCSTRLGTSGVQCIAAPLGAASSLQALKSPPQ